MNGNTAEADLNIVFASVNLIAGASEQSAIIANLVNNGQLVLGT